MLPPLTLGIGFALPAVLIAGSALSRLGQVLQALALVAALACIQWAHYQELAPFTAPLHASRDWIWLLSGAAALLACLPRPRWLLALAGPALVIGLAQRLDLDTWPLWQRAVASLLLGLGVIAAGRSESQARSTLPLAILLASCAAACVLAHSATLGLFAAGLAVGPGLLVLAGLRVQQRDPANAVRAGLGAAVAALTLSAWLYADLPLVSALCLAGGLIAQGLPGAWVRSLLVAALCAGALAPLLLDGAAPNPYR